jgi:hypothetical protein
LLVRQLLSIKQTSAVSEHIDRFSVLVDQLSAHSSQADPLYYIMRFIDGLTEELRAHFLIQRPSSLDTAFVLAQLQEEVAPLQGRRSSGSRIMLLMLALPAIGHYHLLLG